MILIDEVNQSVKYLLPPQPAQIHQFGGFEILRVPHIGDFGAAGIYG